MNVVLVHVGACVMVTVQHDMGSVCECKRIFSPLCFAFYWGIFFFFCAQARRPSSRNAKSCLASGITIIIRCV